VGITLLFSELYFVPSFLNRRMFELLKQWVLWLNQQVGVVVESAGVMSS
jgi:hypothetical protein